MRVAIVRASYDVISGEQDLPYAQVMSRERRGVPLDEQTLTNARGRLLRCEVTRPRTHPQRCESGSDGTRRHEHDLDAGAVSGREDVDEAVDTFAGKVTARAGQ